ncbi:hypothetical protein M2163_000132 [Streptomyces sp. SAI-135]|nr:hypothetical protein [Streptomyces sp. SAI-090]MDH6554987.1 hypothetical protein [Streptomyces sp. SAI-041]MDH6574254.1 hypothetical protein [Streptomyces sp. SAI-117]MDH6581014.1 hypothetical protein [Streptomyces sp. SAI-133]MDH6613024.1 hypothetical protein [Streptomyces sp. SAI-135]
MGQLLRQRPLRNDHGRFIDDASWGGHRHHHGSGRHH